MSRTLTPQERANLPVLLISIPEFDGSHPFSKGENPEVYRSVELKKNSDKKSIRTDWFEKKLLGIWLEIERPVPFVFLVDGKVRSLDAGCLGYLINRGDELNAFEDGDGYIVEVEPSKRLAERYEGLARKLREEVRNLATDGTVQLPVNDLDLGFDLDAAPDERRKSQSLQAVREGGREFRRRMLEQWNFRCIATGNSVKAALEAAHVFRYLGPHTNRADNGLLLRADIHRLFDRNLICIDTDRDILVWRVSSRIGVEEYGWLQGHPLPNDARELLRGEFWQRHRMDFED